jgi:O-antigen ligase
MDRRHHAGSAITVAATGVLITAVALFGAVEVWSSALISASVFTLFLLWVFRLCIKNGSPEPMLRDGRRDRVMLFAVFLCIAGYGILQIIPLPSALVKIVSPATFHLYSFYSVDRDPQMFLSLYPYKTQTELIRIFTYALFFFLFAYATRSAHSLDRTVKILSYFGFALAVFALLQKATWNDKLYWFREISGASPFGPFVNRNHFAGFTGMLIPLTLGIAFTRQRRERQALFGFFALIMSVALFLSLSRAGILSFFAGITIFTLFLLWQRLRTKKIWALVSFLFILFLYLLYLGTGPIVDRFYQTDIGREERLTVWADTFRAFQDFAFTGTGLGTYLHVFPLYSADTSSFLYDHAHCDYLEFLLETGAVGVLLLCLFLFLFLKYSFSGSWTGKKGVIKIALLSSMVTIAVHSIFDFNLHIPSNALMLAAVMGMAYAQRRFSQEEYQH